MEKISDNKYRIVVNNKDLLDDPGKNQSKKLVICDKHLSQDQFLYVSNARLDTVSRNLTILDFYIIDTKKSADSIVIEPELLALVDSMDSTPNEILEFLFQEELEEDEVEESQVSDTEDEG